MAIEGGPLAELAFNLEYEGPALAAHEMDVRQLAPALFATAELFQEMNRLEYPDNPPVSVNVRATNEGSFVVDLILLLGGGAVHVLTSPEVTAMANLSSLLGGLKGLIAYRKFRAGRAIQSVVPAGPGTVRVKFDENAEIEIPANVKAFEENPTISRSLAEIVRPLDQDGVNQVRFRNEEITIGIKKNDAPVFLSPPMTPLVDPEVINEESRQMVLRVVGLWFRKGNKWKVTDGENEFWATVLDDGFLSDVLSARVVVTPHDLLRCQVKITQKLDAAGQLHTVYEIVKVAQHQSRPQRSLLEGDDDAH